MLLSKLYGIGSSGNGPLGQILVVKRLLEAKIGDNVQTTNSRSRERVGHGVGGADAKGNATLRSVDAYTTSTRSLPAWLSPGAMSHLSLVDHARTAFEAGVRAVHPSALMAKQTGESLTTRIRQAKRVYVATIGKAAAPWGRWWAEQVSVEAGAIVVPKGYAQAPDRLPSTWSWVEAGHPHPTENSARAGRLLLDMARACGHEDLFIIGLSGGGSACTACPPRGVAMDEVRTLNEHLLHSGLAIDAVNAVRKHVLQVGGGRLAAAAHPGRVECRAISDVPGDDLSTIASGPTVGDPTTYADAITVLHEAGVWSEVPVSIRTHLREGKRGRHPETVAPGDARLARAETTVIASNDDAQHAAASHLKDRGYKTHTANTLMQGEARTVGYDHARDLLEARAPCAFVWGGEPTVHVTGAGVGGRNQEAALAAVQPLAQYEVPAVLFCAGTDGIDGPTGAAGAWATPETLTSAEARGLDPDAYLANNDSNTFFEQVGGLYRPGPTGTNVMDLHIGLVEQP